MLDILVYYHSRTRNFCSHTRAWKEIVSSTKSMHPPMWEHRFCGHIMFKFWLSLPDCFIKCIGMQLMSSSCGHERYRCCSDRKTFIYMCFSGGCMFYSMRRSHRRRHCVLERSRLPLSNSFGKWPLMHCLFGSVTYKPHRCLIHFVLYRYRLPRSWIHDLAILCGVSHYLSHELDSRELDNFDRSD